MVSDRARNICEYCLIAEEDSFYRHQIEHIISLKHDGDSDRSNLALACVFCNRNKGSDVGTFSGIDRTFTRFYNPRTDSWNEHFKLEGILIAGLTDIGEGTARILRFNGDDRLAERKILLERGRYPSESAMLKIRGHI